MSAPLAVRRLPTRVHQGLRGSQKRLPGAQMDSADPSVVLSWTIGVLLTAVAACHIFSGAQLPKTAVTLGFANGLPACCLQLWLSHCWGVPCV